MLSDELWEFIPLLLLVFPTDDVLVLLPDSVVPEFIFPFEEAIVVSVAFTAPVVELDDIEDESDLEVSFVVQLLHDATAKPIEIQIIPNFNPFIVYVFNYYINHYKSYAHRESRDKKRGYFGNSPSFYD